MINKEVQVVSIIINQGFLFGSELRVVDQINISLERFYKGVSWQL